MPRVSPNLFARRLLNQLDFAAWCLLAGIAGLLLIFATGTSANAETIPKAERIALQLKWFHSFQFAGYYAAKAKGFYAAEGLEVDIRERNPAASNIEQVLNGEAQYGVADSGLLRYRLQGKPVVVLASIFQHNPLILIALKSSGIVSPLEMRGKRIMSDPHNDSPLLAMLADAGIKSGDFTHVSHTFNYDDLIEGKVDVVSGYSTNEPFYYKSKGVEINVINPLNYGIDFLGDNLFSTEGEIRKHPERAEKFLRASLKGWEYALKNPAEIIQLILDQYNAKGLEAPAKLQFEVQEMKKLMVPDVVPIGTTDLKRFQRIREIYPELAQSKAGGTLSGFIYNQAAPPDLPLSEEEKAWLRAHPVIRVGVDRDFAPYEWIDGQGRYHGLAADFLKHVERHLGVKLEIVKGKPWAETLEMAKRGELDMLSCVVRTPEREKYLKFTESYAENPAVIIDDGRSGYLGSLARLAGKKVAIENGYFMQERISREHPKIRIIPANNIGDALRLVAQGTADAYVGDAGSASYTIRKLALLDLRLSGQTEYLSAHAFAATLANPELAGILDKVIDTIPLSEKERILNHWMSLHVDPGIRIETTLKYIAAIALLILFMSLWVVRLRREIHARRASESALMESEARFRTMADAAPVLIWMSGTDKLHSWFNQAWLDFTGRGMAQELDNGWADGVHPDDLQHYTNIYDSNFDARHPFLMEYRLRSRDGTFRWLSNHGVPRFNAQGEFEGYIGSCTDITESKTLVDALQASEQRWKFALEGSGDGIWDWNAQTNKVFYSRQWKAMLGYAEDEIGDDLEEWEKRIHPDDKSRRHAELEQHFSGQAPVYSSEHRVQCKDGGYKWILDRGIVLERTEDHKPLRVIGTHTDISRLKMLELSLRVSHDLLKQLSAQVPGVIYQFRMYPDGRSCFPYASENIQEIYEVTPEQVREDASAVFSILHPDDYDAIVASIRESFQSLQPWQLEYRVVLPRQGERWRSGHARPQRLDDGSVLWYGFITDVTEQKQADEASRLIQLKLQESIKAGNVGLWDWNLDTNEVFFSDEWKRQIGYAADEMSPHYSEWETRFHPDDLEPALQAVRWTLAAPTERLFHAEFRLRHRDGHYVWIAARGNAVLNDKGQPTRMLGSHVDITAQKQAEKALREAKELAERTAQLKSSFLANMSHEIRTPMNGIIGLTELALLQPSSPELRDYLSKIHSSSQSLLSILNDILDFSKIEAGSMVIECAPFHLDKVVEDLRTLFGEHARSKHLDFDLRVDENAPRMLMGDSLRLRQILSNLIGNAIKFTEQGSVSLIITPKQIDPEHVRLEFRVEDTGIGISPEDRDKLFQPFSQVDGSITRRFGGTGLGLAISRDLLQRMGSQFHLDSTPGRGTVFAFELVLGIASADSLTASPSSSPLEATNPARGYSATAARMAGSQVLVAEDNAINQQVVSEFLGLRGIAVEVANNGQEALDWLQRKTFDAVLMDVHMPVMGGVEATRRLRENPRLVDLPVIALTAGVTREERDNCLASGMNDFIAKPIDTQQLMDALVRWITPGSATPFEVPQAPAASDQWSELASALPEFELNNVRMSLGGHRDLFMQLLAAFREEFSEEAPQIPIKLAQGDLHAAQLLLHKLKGVAGNIGAMALHRICQTLELQLKAGSYDRQTLEQWQHSYATTLRQIDQALNGAAAASAMAARTSDGDAGLLRQNAQELDALLAQNDFIAEALLDKIRAHLPVDQHGFYEALAQQIYAVDYERARATLQALIERPRVDG